MGNQQSNRDAIGARVELQLASNTITRLQKGGCGLMSTHDPRLTIGLGSNNIIQAIRVYWPSGQMTELKQVKVDQEIIIEEPLR